LQEQIMMRFKAQRYRSTMTAMAIAGMTIVVSASASAAGSGTWVTTASLHVAREGQTATLLPSNGAVVVAGGETNNPQVTNTTEVYSPTQHAWLRSGPLNQARGWAGAVLLKTHVILVAGGCTGNCLGASTRSVELYNPTSAVWSTTASMGTARVYFGLVLLRSGKVLAVGGCTGQNSNGCTGVTAAAELFDPVGHTWHPTGSLNVARGSMTATLLTNGQVLVAGGIDGANNPLNSAELYNPATGSWRKTTGILNVARDEHTATLLANGQVLVAGGENRAGVSTQSTELYNPATGTWTATGNLHAGRLEHAAVLLANGAVLVSGGSKVNSAGTALALASAEIYNVATGAWKTTGSMHAARIGHASTLLLSGLVLDAAGANLTNALASAELYRP
jgi:N-acetylneuraminic acid mutarotase